MLNVEGWFELGLDETMVISPGDRIRYITNANPPDPNSGLRMKENDNYDEAFTESPRNKFRTGGWVISVNTDEDLDRPYILYRPHVASLGPQSIQFDYIYRLFYLPMGAEGTVCRKPVKYPIPQNRTNYPVCLNDPEGNAVTVYYGRDESKRRQFMNTQKFKRATKYGWNFIEN